MALGDQTKSNLPRAGDDKRANTSSKHTKRTGAKTGAPKRATHLGGHVKPGKPAGNAQLDPAQQTVRTDMPRAAQKGRGKPGRGTAPSRQADRSHQPRPHDHNEP